MNCKRWFLLLYPVRIENSLEGSDFGLRFLGRTYGQFLNLQAQKKKKKKREKKKKKDLISQFQFFTRIHFRESKQMFTELKIDKK